MRLRFYSIISICLFVLLHSIKRINLTTIKEIYLRNEISKEAFNVCFFNEIDFLKELKEIHSKYGSFMSFRNCGDKTNLELISICVKYYSNMETFDFKELESNEVTILLMITSLNQTQQNLINYFIQENYSKLSQRTRNGLGRYLEGEISLEKINVMIFSKQFFNPNNLKNLGNKSIPELQHYLKEVKDYILKIYNPNQEEILLSEIPSTAAEKLDNQINNLNEFQIKVVNNYITVITERLSARGKNAIIKHLRGDLHIYNFFEHVFSKSKFRVKNIENIGKGTVDELTTYLKDIQSFLNKVTTTLDKIEFNKLEIKVHLMKTFREVSIPDHILDSISLFKLMDYFLQENTILDKVETFVLKNTYYVFSENKHNSLNYVADILGASSERARQIRNSLTEKISAKIKSLKCFEKKILSNYNIDFKQSSIIILDEKADDINRIDNTNFSKQFITLILSFLLEEEYQLTGSKEDVLIFKESRTKARHNWKNIYLIKTKLHQTFCFEKLIEDLECRIKEQNDKTYSLNFKGYLSKFFKADNFIFLDEIFPICKMLITEEFSFNCDNEENLVFERNTYKTLPEYAYEALEIIGKPSHIEEINKQIKILKPDYNSDISNSTLSKAFGFVPYGRANIFGLKKWDTEKRNIKGGTIRDMAEEYLQNCSNPVKYNVVANYVLKYRPESNLKSIIYNLKMEENNRFVFFKGSLIGIKTKNYQTDLFSVLESNEKPITRSWQENYQELLNFIAVNHKLPSGTVASIDEKRISVWYYVQCSKINKNLLDESKTKLIVEIRENNKPREQKSIQFKSDGYVKLLEFVEKNKRLPSTGKKEESTLYNFFYKQRKRFEEGDLDSDEKLKFIQITNLLQQYKSKNPY